MNVFVIKRHVTETWNAPPPTFLAVAIDEEAAKCWIQDEVDGKHSSSHQYMTGKSADWWIKYGTFSITSVEVQMGVKR